MRTTGHLRWLLCVATASLFGVSPDDPAPQPPPIMLTIRLPVDADLEIQGKKVEGTGELRHESLVPAKETETIYTFKATWTECDTKRVVKRTMRLKPGQEAELDLNLESTAEEKMIVTLINKEREKAGLAPLLPDHKMNRAARAHSLNMAKQNNLTHSLDGKSAPDRLKEAGYRSLGYGENVGAGARTPEMAVQLWMNSPPHKKNILTGDFTETGIGIAVGRQGKKYHTQVFAVPARR